MRIIQETAPRKGVAMAFVEFKDVRKIYTMGEVQVAAVDGMSFEIEQKVNSWWSSAPPVQAKRPCLT